MSEHNVSPSANDSVLAPEERSVSQTSVPEEVPTIPTLAQIEPSVSEHLVSEVSTISTLSSTAPSVSKTMVPKLPTTPAAIDSIVSQNLVPEVPTIPTLTGSIASQNVMPEVPAVYTLDTTEPSVSTNLVPKVPTIPTLAPTESRVSKNLVPEVPTTPLLNPTEPNVSQNVVPGVPTTSSLTTTEPKASQTLSSIIPTVIDRPSQILRMAMTKKARKHTVVIHHPNTVMGRSLSIPMQMQDLIAGSSALATHIAAQGNTRPVSSWYKSIFKFVSSKNEIRPQTDGEKQSVSSVLETFFNPVASTGSMEAIESDENTEEEVERQFCSSCCMSSQGALVRATRWLRRQKRLCCWFFWFIWFVYVAYALVHAFIIEGQQYKMCSGGGLIVWTSALLFGQLVLVKFIMRHAHYLDCLRELCCDRPRNWIKHMWERRYVRPITLILIVIGVVVITYHGHINPESQGQTIYQAVSVAGYITVLVFAYMLSTNPASIKWRLIVRNLVLHCVVIYSVFIWDFGLSLLQCSAEKSAQLFSFGKQAAIVLFSHDLPEMLAIKLLCTLTLTGCYVHILYYYGIVQRCLHKLGFVLEHIAGGTSIESSCAALATLFGGIEAAVMLEPYIILLTLSELHTFIASGFACMSGEVLVIYLGKGIDPVSLMTANFASFNGVIAVSKIVYPETDISVTTYHDLKFVDVDEFNFIDAAVHGAVEVLKVLVNVISSLIAMIAVVSMTNSFIGWLFYNIGVHHMDGIAIFAMVIRPLIFLFGVEWKHAGRVARLFAHKTIENEYSGYALFMAEQKKHPLPLREAALTTALLYGFGNLAHIGVTSAFMTALAPERRRDINVLVPRAMVTAVLSNMLTTAVMGTLVTPHPSWHPTPVLKNVTMH